MSATRLYPVRPLCKWFARCINPSDGTVHHPILGDVPTCQRCATKLGLDLDLYPTEQENPNG